MSLDFLGQNIDANQCMACQIKDFKYIPPEGLLFCSDHFMIHQDPYVAIPGFLIVSPKRHIFSVDEMTQNELLEMGKIIALAEKAVRCSSEVESITIIQEEHIKEGHLHIWIFPWHDFLLEDYEHSLKVIRTITEQYKSDTRYLDDTMRVARKIKAFLEETTVCYNQLDFSGQDLCGFDFSGRDLSRANFQGATLKRCNFTDCDLSFADFNDADLYRASFCRSKLYSCTFKNADLTRADFSNAQLYGIKIFGADMTHTIFDDIVMEEKNKDYDKAEDIYNTIKRACSENGNKEAAAKYYYKQCVARRKQLKGPARFLNWLFADLLIGYGERLTRCLVLCSVVIIGFGVLFFYLAGCNNLFHCMLSSLSVFFGFEPVFNISNVVNMSFWYAIERLIGYFFIALAIIGVTRRIVRD